MKKDELINASAAIRIRVTADVGSRIKKTASEACLKLATVLDLVGDVEDIVGQTGEPCPVQSQTAIKKLRALLGLKAAKAEKPKTATKPKPEARAEEVDAASDMTCGKPPYVAEIVRASGTGTLWTAPVRYRSEPAAESAIIQKATRLKHRCSGLSRHWVTGNAEHMIDYGSYFYYGRIMSVENWMAMKKEAK